MTDTIQAGARIYFDTDGRANQVQPGTTTPNTIPVSTELADLADAEALKTEARREAAKKAAATRKANADAALAKMAEGDTIDTEEFLAMVRKWATRKSLCTTLEQVLQTQLKLRFLETVSVNGGYDDDLRLTPRPDQRKTLTKLEIAILWRHIQRSYGGYINTALRTLIEKLNLPEPVVYEDRYTATVTHEITRRDLERRGHLDPGSEISDDGLRRYVRDYIGGGTGNITITRIPDPRRPAATPASTN